MSTDTARITAPQTRRRSTRTGAITSTSEAIQFPVVVWIVHWLLTQIPATLAYHYGTVRSGPDPGENSGAYQIVLGPMSGIAGLLVEPFRNWDGTWYRLVALNGHDPGGANFVAKAAFWPLYPWLMKTGHDFTGLSPESVGYIISNISFLGALLLVFRLVTLDFNANVARATVVGLAIFPTTFFFTAVYTESLFMMLAVGSLYAARKNEWFVAGVLGLLAALTRSAGVMLLAPLAVLFAQQYGWNPRRWFPQAFSAALPALGPLIFGWHLRESGSKFLDWVNVQWQWNRYQSTPWRTVDCELNGCVTFLEEYDRDQITPPADWGWVANMFQNFNWTHLTSWEFRNRVGDGDILEITTTLLAFVVLIVGLKKLPFYYTAFALPPLIVPLFSPSTVNAFMSMPRFVLPLFPIFVMLAILIQGKRFKIVAIAISSFLSVVLTMQFALWYWVS